MQTSTTVQAATPAPAKPVPAVGYDWEGYWDDTSFHIVEMEQGRSAALKLKYCHVALEGLSNRRGAECERIAAEGMRIQVRQEAEEKRKDAEYDKVHSKMGKKPRQ